MIDVSELCNKQYTWRWPGYYGYDDYDVDDDDDGGDDDEEDEDEDEDENEDVEEEEEEEEAEGSDENDDENDANVEDAGVWWRMRLTGSWRVMFCSEVLDKLTLCPCVKVCICVSDDQWLPKVSIWERNQVSSCGGPANAPHIQKLAPLSLSRRWKFREIMVWHVSTV